VSTPNDHVDENVEMQSSDEGEDSDDEIKTYGSEVSEDSDDL
jgi:hypothetical protein